MIGLQLESPFPVCNPVANARRRASRQEVLRLSAEYFTGRWRPVPPVVIVVEEADELLGDWDEDVQD